MKKLLMTVVACAALSGCANAPTQSQINDLVAKIQQYTAQACAFQPQAASVATLIATLYPQGAIAVDVVNSVGNAICAAPTTKAASRNGLVTKVVRTSNGRVVPVAGRRL